MLLKSGLFVPGVSCRVESGVERLQLLVELPVAGEPPVVTRRCPVIGRECPVDAHEAIRGFSEVGKNTATDAGQQRGAEDAGVGDGRPFEAPQPWWAVLEGVAYSARLVGAIILGAVASSALWRRN